MSVRRAVRHTGCLMLCLVWVSTAVAGVCMPYADPGDASEPDRHHVTGHCHDTGHIDSMCCRLTVDVPGQPALARGPSPAQTKLAALPARDPAAVVESSTVPASVSATVDSLFPSPPYYLLYNRLLIPFS